MIERRRKRNQSRQVSLFVFTALAILASSPAGQAAGDTIAEEVTFTNGDLTLSGTLTLPSAGAPHPAVLLIGGSGPQDRDGAMRVYPWLPAVLSYRGASNPRGRCSAALRRARSGKIHRQLWGGD